MCIHEEFQLPTGSVHVVGKTFGEGSTSRDSSLGLYPSPQPQEAARLAWVSCYGASTVAARRSDCDLFRASSIVRAEEVMPAMSWQAEALETPLKTMDIWTLIGQLFRNGTRARRPRLLLCCIAGKEIAAITNEVQSMPRNPHQPLRTFLSLRYAERARRTLHRH